MSITQKNGPVRFLSPLPRLYVKSCVSFLLVHFRVPWGTEPYVARQPLYIRILLLPSILNPSPAVLRKKELRVIFTGKPYQSSDNFFDTFQSQPKKRERFEVILW